MKTIKYFDLVGSQHNPQTIDLAEILGVAPMQEITQPIKIKIEKIITKNEGVHEIPVRIINATEKDLSIDQLQDLVKNNLASKLEFRTLKKILSNFSL